MVEVTEPSNGGSGDLLLWSGTKKLFIPSDLNIAWLCLQTSLVQLLTEQSYRFLSVSQEVKNNFQNLVHKMHILTPQMSK